MARLAPTTSPNLPVAPASYARQHFDVLNNVLRLYFNRIDGIFTNLFGVLGGKYIENPHISASDNTDQYADGNNDPTKVLWDTLDSSAGFTLNLDSTATASQSGVYKIDYSLQFANTANASHDVYVWLEVTNGTTSQVPGSASKFTLSARKSSGDPTFLVAYSSITFTINAGDSIALWWATDLAYNPVGPVHGIYMEYIAAQTVPYAHPAVPSAVGSITFVSRNGT